MLLRNLGQLLRPRQSSGSTLQMKDSSGTIVTGSSISYFSASVPFSVYADGTTTTTVGTYPGLALGTGTTPPTVDDYKMENPLDDNSLTNVSNSRTIAAATYLNPNIWVFNQTVKNITQQDLTITEIGLFTYIRNTNNDRSACTLFTRDVIDPVVIAPEESKTFILTIDFTQMIASMNAS